MMSFFDSNLYLCCLQSFLVFFNLSFYTHCMSLHALHAIACHRTPLHVIARHCTPLHVIARITLHSIYIGRRIQWKSDNLIFPMRMHSHMHIAYHTHTCISPTCKHIHSRMQAHAYMQACTHRHAHIAINIITSLQTAHINKHTNKKMNIYKIRPTVACNTLLLGY